MAVYRIPAAGGVGLGSFLARNPYLSNLSLRSSPDLLTEKGLAGLSSGLGDAELPRLRSLDLDNCDIQPGAAHRLGRLFAKCPALEELRLWSNPGLMTAEGLDGLKQGLGGACLPALTRLHLGSCDIQASAAESLGTLLARSSQLQILSLSLNRFLLTNEGIAGLERGLGGVELSELRELLVYRTFNTKSLTAKAALLQRIGASSECVVRA